MRSEMGIFWAAVVAVCCVPHLSKAETFKCTVSQNVDMMTFTILDGSRSPDVNLSACEFAWDDGRNIPIADNSNHIPPVMEKSLNSLTTSQCVEGIISKQNCPTLTGVWIEYIANCTVTCTSKDSEDHGEPKKDQKEEGQGGLSKLWIAAGVIAVVVVLAGLFLCYKFRTRGCGQCEGRYTTVKLESNQSRPLPI